MKKFLKKSIIIIVCGALFISCAQNFSVENVIEIDTQEETESIEESGLLAGMELIQLETNDSVLITSIDKVIVSSDRLFVADLKESYTIFIFDLDGNYINKINKLGRGVDEYVALFDIFYNNVDNTINLLSRASSKILTYTKNGEFVSVRTLPAEFIEIQYLNGSYFATTGFYQQEKLENNNMIVFDSTLNMIHGRFIINEHRSSNSSYHNLYIYNNNVYYVDNWLFKVFDANSESHCYTFNFGASQRPDHLNNMNVYRDALISDRSVANFITSIDWVQESDKYILATYIHDGSNKIVVFDKKRCDAKGYVLDFVEEYYALSFGKIVGMDQDRIITYIPASRVVDKHRGYNDYNDFREDFPKQIERLQTKFLHVSEDDNPFIAIYKLKS